MIQKMQVMVVLFLLCFTHFSQAMLEVDKCGAQVMQKVVSCYEEGDFYKASEQVRNDFMATCDRCYRGNSNRPSEAKCNADYARSIADNYGDFVEYYKGRSDCRFNKNALNEFDRSIEISKIPEKQPDPGCIYVGGKTIETMEGIGYRDSGQGSIVCEKGGSISVCKAIARCQRNAGFVRAGESRIYCLAKDQKCPDSATECYKDVAVDKFKKEHEEKRFNVLTPPSSVKAIQ